MSVTTWAIVAVSVIALASCEGRSETQRPFALAFIVESDPGVRLPRTHVFIDGDPVGESDAHGRVNTKIYGQSGQRVEVSHDCPDGHEASSPRKSLRLRKFEGIDKSRSRAMEITLRCRPLQRLAAFVVRAKNGPDLPVLLNGQHVARTNGSGVAHFSSRGATGTEYIVELDTTERPQLRPQRPSHLFTLPDADEIFVINQSFNVQEEPRRRKRRRPRITKIE
jgi:hypothetical protein